MMSESAEEVAPAVSTVMIPASVGDALGMLTSGIGYLAGTDPAQLPAETLAEYLGVLEQADAIAAAARGKILAAFRAKDGTWPTGSGPPRTWLVHCLGITKGQAAEHLAVAAVARQHPRLLVGAAQAGVDLSALAAIYAELRNRTAPPDPDRERDPELDNGVSLDTTLDGTGVLRGNLSPECAAMVIILSLGVSHGCDLCPRVVDSVFGAMAAA
jgi:hypothetical protein